MTEAEIHKIVRKHQSRMSLMTMGLLLFLFGLAFVFPIITGWERRSSHLEFLGLFTVVVYPMIAIIGHFVEKTVTEVVLNSNK